MMQICRIALVDETLCLSLGFCGCFTYLYNALRWFAWCVQFLECPSPSLHFCDLLPHPCCVFCWLSRTRKTQHPQRPRRRIKRKRRKRRPKAGRRRRRRGRLWRRRRKERPRQPLKTALPRATLLPASPPLPPLLFLQPLSRPRSVIVFFFISPKLI